AKSRRICRRSCNASSYRTHRSYRSHGPIGVCTLRIVMMGTGTFAEPTLEALLAGPDPVVGVFTQPGREGVQKRGSTRQVGRGVAPMAWAILNGEPETGVTIIRMTAGLDAGDMLAKASIPIGDETAGELEAKLAPLGARLAVETIERLKAGPVSGEKQDPALV